MPTVPLACVVIADLTVLSTTQLAENEMLVDDYEQYPNEKTDDVVVSGSGSDEPEPTLSAADRTFLSCVHSESTPFSLCLRTYSSWPTSSEIKAGVKNCEEHLTQLKEFCDR